MERIAAEQRRDRTAYSPSDQETDYFEESDDEEPDEEESYQEESEEEAFEEESDREVLEAEDAPNLEDGGEGIGDKQTGDGEHAEGQTEDCLNAEIPRGEEGNEALGIVHDEKDEGEAMSGVK